MELSTQLANLKQSLPVYTRDESKRIVSLYNIEMHLNALRLLGFDLSYNRKQGVDHIRVNHDTVTKGWSRITEETIYLRGALSSVVRKHETLKYRASIHGLNKAAKLSLKDEDKLVAAKVNGMVGLNEAKESYVLCLDIDNHGQYVQSMIDAKVDRLVSLIGQPVFIEKSCINGGYHLYFRFNEIWDRQINHQMVRAWLVSEGLDCVDIRLKDGIFRLPAATNYITGSLIDGQFIMDDLFSPNEWAQSVISNSDNPAYINNLYDFEQRVFNTPGIMIEIDDFKSKPAPVKPLFKGKTRKAGQSYIDSLADKYPLTAGNRRFNMWCMALEMASRARTVEEYYDMCCRAYVDSKDWTVWTDEQRLEECRQTWDRALPRVVVNPMVGSEHKFISNIDPEADLVTLRLLDDRNLTALFNGGKCMRLRKHKEIVTLTGEIIKQIHYSVNRIKELSPDLSPEETQKMSYLTSSAQFSQTWCDRLKDHYNMTIDVYKETRKILNSGILPIKRICKQYSYTDQTYCMAYTFSHNYKDMGTINCLLIMLLRTINDKIELHSVRDLSSLCICLPFDKLKADLKMMIRLEFSPMAGISPG